MSQRRDQLAGGFIAPPAAPEAPVSDFLQMITAGKATDVLTTHGTGDVPTQQHRRELADLIDVVPLLPPPNPAPRDLGRRIERVERVGGHTVAIALMPGDAEVAELELFLLAHEHVEGREVAMQRLPAMQRVERAEERGDFAAHEALRLRATLLEPRADVAVLCILHHHAVAHAVAIDLGEPVEHPQCARLLLEQLGEVRLAQPGGETMADFDANLRRQPALRGRSRQVDLAETALADQAGQPVDAARLRAASLGFLSHVTYLRRVRAAVKPTNLPYVSIAASKASFSSRSREFLGRQRGEPAHDVSGSVEARSPQTLGAHAQWFEILHSTVGHWTFVVSWPPRIRT